MSYQSPSGGSTYSVPNSSLAVLSLIAGILGLTFLPLVGSIVAVITGNMAKKEIQASAGSLSGEGLATAGSVLGWIGIVLGVLGLCIAGFAIALPLCLGLFAISTSGSGFLLPSLLVFF